MISVHALSRGRGKKENIAVQGLDEMAQHDAAAWAQVGSCGVCMVSVISVRPACRLEESDTVSQKALQLPVVVACCLPDV